MSMAFRGFSLSAAICVILMIAVGSNAKTAVQIDSRNEGRFLKVQNASRTFNRQSPELTYNCGQPVIVDTRIVGGQVSLAGKFPWQVLFKGLSSSTGRHQTTCGGSLIGNQWVVTAAHCTAGKTAETVHVVLGDFDMTTSDGGNDKEFSIAAIYEHPDYDSSTLRNDISLLKLGGSAIYSDYVIPVCLPTQNVDVSVGTSCWISGWGVTNTATSSSPDTMHEAQVPIIDQSTCSSWYGSEGISIDQKMVCAGFQQGGVDTCQGDSGGPLVCQDSSNAYILEGITSFGIGCAQPGRPGVYTRVSEFRTWIDSTMSSNAATSTFFGYTATSCGTTIRSSQVVRLPVDSETQLYAGGMDCVWTLIPPNTTVTTRLTFVERFAVEPWNSCQYDYLTIYTASGMQLGDTRMCGFTLPSMLESTHNEIIIRFRSDSTLQYEGFAINVEFLNSGATSYAASTLSVFSATMMLALWMLTLG